VNNTIKKLFQVHFLREMCSMLMKMFNILVNDMLRSCRSTNRVKDTML
jgi:hypothetical protein